MPQFRENEVDIYFEEDGEGFPLLLIAPGGMRSAVDFWERTPFNPIVEFRDRFRVIAMDQRNAGRSRAPISADDGWHVYTDDQLRLLDHLGADAFHVAGMCIGGPYCMGLIARAPDRVASAVLMQPIGLDDNRQAFYDMFDNWADELKPQRPEVPESAWTAFKHNLYDGDFLFNTSLDDVAACRTPLLVLRGDDLYHPSSVSEEIARLAPHARLIESWKEGAARTAAIGEMRAFLEAHTPAAA
jgi:pimeloyl-ACP methyl ester carboxylesterase